MSTPEWRWDLAVSPTRLGDEVADRLRRYILEGGLTEGARLPSERVLAERIGTSRATISQALRMLAVMGLVDIRHGSGVYVRHDPGSLIATSLDLMLELDPASVEELADFRHWLERSIVSGPRLPQFRPALLVAGFDDLVDARGAVERWIEADAIFHGALVEAGGNRYLATAYEKAHRKILSVTYADWVERGATPRWLRGKELVAQIDVHRRILEAAVAADRPALIEALDLHQQELVTHLDQRR